MHSELGVSKDVLAQRLIKDLKLWKVCIFWGKVSIWKESPFKNFRIFVRDRDKKMADCFRNFNLKRELEKQGSELATAIIKHVTETNDQQPKDKPYRISFPIGKTQKLDCFLEVRSLGVRKSFSHKGERWFIALLRPALTN